MAQIATALEAVEKLDALRAAAEMSFELRAGHRREFAVEIFRKEREDPCAIFIVHGGLLRGF
jgi:hypothetical protein